MEIGFKPTIELIIRGGIGMKKYLFKYKGGLILSLTMVVVSSIINIYLAFVFKKLVDVTGSTNINDFYKVAIFTLLFIIIGSIIHFITDVVKHSYIKNTITYLKQDTFKNIMNKSIPEFNSNNSGKYMSTISNDLKMVEDDYFKSIFMLIGSFVSFIGSIISLFILSYKITIILIILSLFTILIPKVFQNKLSKKREIYSGSLEKFTEKIKDIFTGFETIKNFNIGDKIFDEYSTLNLTVEKNKFNFNIYNSFASLIAEIIGGLMFVSVFILGVYLTIKGEITLGTAIACVQLANNVVEPVYSGLQYLNEIKSVKGISNKILNISKNNLIPNNNASSKKSFENSIKFKNVSFRYEDNKPVLENITLDIFKNKKYAFVGMSGSGKSTILRLLLKQYDNYTGSIMIDDVSIRDINADDIYSMESVIQQNVFLFDDTIKNNITLFSNYNENDINKAIKISGLEPVINKLENGIESPIGENGNLISGGEKQRISIARSLLRKSPILILDEATASLDNETAYSIEDTILDMKNTTLISVTHKLWGSLLNKYDKIFVIQDGKIIEQGSFKELIDLKGYFYSLYTIENVNTNNESKRLTADAS